MPHKKFLTTAIAVFCMVSMLFLSTPNNLYAANGYEFVVLNAYSKTYSRVYWGRGLFNRCHLNGQKAQLFFQCPFGSLCQRLWQNYRKKSRNRRYTSQNQKRGSKL